MDPTRGSATLGQFFAGSSSDAAPAPGGPLPGWLFEPADFLSRAVELLSGASGSILWVGGVLVGGAVIAGAVVVMLRSWRRRSLLTGGRYLRIMPPPEIEPDGAITLWMGLHALLRPGWARLVFGQPHLSWETIAADTEASVGLWVAARVPPGLVEQAVQSAWPGARVEPAEAPPLPSRPRPVSCEMRLSESEEYPLGEGIGADPLRLVLGAFSLLSPGEQAMIQILARPVTGRMRHKVRGAARQLRQAHYGAPASGRSRRSSAPDPTVAEDIRMILQKGAHPMWEVVIRVAVASVNAASARGKIHALTGALAVFAGPNDLVRGRLRGGPGALASRAMPKGFLLSAPELARIATLPSPLALPSLQRARARTVAPPRDLPETGKPLGLADHPGYVRKVALHVPDAAHHLHLVGETGTGKSTLIAQMVLADAEAGRAAVVIDPKGDLVNSIVERLPKQAIGRTCLFDPDDPEVAVGLNVLSGEDPDLVVDQIVSVFRRIYADAWGARSDDIMRCACLTLTQVPGATLADVGALLTNDEFRAQVRSDPSRFKNIGDVNLFWDWFEQLGPQRATNIGPLMNKLRAFLLRGPVRAIVGQSDPKLDVGKLIDSGGLLLVRVPKGTIGEETSRVLGAFIVARVWQVCMQRARRAERERSSVGLYVDEMHNYLALPRSFEDMLAEARGYGLGLVLAHQHMGQLTRNVRDALAANARTKVTFATSPDDASTLSKHFAPRLSDYDLANLEAFQAACRPCINGAHGPAFTFRTEPLGPEIDRRAADVRSAAARNFGVPRFQVDARLRNRIGELGDEWVVEPVAESPVALRLDQRPVPDLQGNRR
ncbi:MAG: type IV secretory system conjugative DNA transfer family protein [Actinomycetota bacterium]